MAEDHELVLSEQNLMEFHEVIKRKAPEHLSTISEHKKNEYNPLGNIARVHWGAKRKFGFIGKFGCIFWCMAASGVRQRNAGKVLVRTQTME